MALEPQNLQGGFGGGGLSVTDEFVRQSKLNTAPFRFGAFGLFQERIQENLLNGITAKIAEYGLAQTDDSDFLSPEEASARYGLSVSDPIREQTAAYKSVVEERKANFEKMMYFVDTSGFGGFLADQSIGLMAGLIDPANVIMFGLAGQAIGRGVGAVVSRTSQASRLGVAARSTQRFFDPKTIGGFMRAGAVEEALESATLEAGIEKLHANAFQNDYGVSDYIQNIAYGATIGSLFGGAIGSYKALKGTIEANVEDFINRRVESEVDTIVNTNREFTEGNRIVDTNVAEDFNLPPSKALEDLGIDTKKSALEGTFSGNVFTARYSGKEISKDSLIQGRRNYGEGIYLVPKDNNGGVPDVNSIDFSIEDVALSDGTSTPTPEIIEAADSYLNNFDIDAVSKSDILASTSIEQMFNKVEGQSIVENKPDMINRFHEVLDSQGMRLSDGSVIIHNSENMDMVGESSLSQPDQTFSDEKPQASRILNHTIDPVTSMDYDISFDDMDSVPIILDSNVSKSDPLFEESATLETELNEEFISQSAADEASVGKKEADKYNEKVKESLDPETAPQVVKALSVCMRGNP